MKFIKLEILNLASLDRQGGETIAFDEGALGDSTIFSIVGPTGSGKSTILDAICLALYNRAPRYPRKKGDRNQNIEIFGEPEDGEKNRLAPTDSRNILTRGKKEGHSKLTFLANNGDIYRAEWAVKKLTKNYENAHTALYKISQNGGTMSEEQAEWDKLPQIIGLDYEQFLRTVLIAQGSFANFLTAKENERYELLEKLIGCEEVYAHIAAKIKQQKDEATKVYDQIAASLSVQEKDIIPEDELDAIKTRIAELEAKEKQVKDELLKVGEAIAWYTTDETQLESIARYELVFGYAKQNQEAQREQIARLALHDATVPAIDLYKEMVNAAMEIEAHVRKLQTINEMIGKATLQIETEEKNLETLRTKEKEAVDELERQKPHINKARAIKAEIGTIETDVREKNAAKRDAEEAQRKADMGLADNAENIRKAEQELQKAQEDQKILLESIQKRETQLTDALQEIEKQIEAKNARIAGVDIEQLNADVAALLRTYTLMTSEVWEEHRSLLKEGEPCPLCGGKHHPYKDKNVVSLVQNKLGLELKNKQKQQGEYNETKKELDQLNARKNAAHEYIRNYSAEVQNKKAEAERKVMDARTRLETENGKTPNLLEQQKEKADALAKAMNAQKSAQQNLENKQAELRAELGEKDPDAYETELANASKASQKAVEDKDSEISRLREIRNGYNGEKKTTQEVIDKKEVTKKSNHEELTSWLAKYNEDKEELISEETVVELYSATDNWELIRAQQKQLAEAYTSAETTLSNEKKTHQAHQQTKPEQEKEALLVRKAELEGLSNNELVDTKARLQRHETAKQQMGEMFEQKQQAEKQKIEWEQIADAIGGDGKTLRKIAQCYTLRFLIEHANVEIRKFNSRYELQQVKNSLGIRVIDHDRADDIRDTTSLSGGETFIVSLGLALGLSALSSRNISFENLFIDEGFGTLDPDTLATVIDSLAMLQSSQGKKVGVISHTDTMSERITTQIRVIKNGNSGSSHIEIYP